MHVNRYNVYFDFDNEVEFGVLVATEANYETEREQIIIEAKNKLIDRGFDVKGLKCTEVNFLEKV
jgi:hypothetical protein